MRDPSAGQSDGSRHPTYCQELPNDWGITIENANLGCAPDGHGPFDSQWADAFHDHFADVLAGGNLGQLQSTFTAYGDSWQDGLIYTESHDEVAMWTAALHAVAATAKAGNGPDRRSWPILARGIPMLFMGQEGGEDLQFGQDDSHIDPRTAPTWWDDPLPLENYQTDPGRSKVQRWWRRIIDIRRGDLGRFAWGDIAVTHINDANGVIAFTRDNGKYLIVLNFKGASWDHYDVGVHGRYQELANTSWPAFNLGNYAERTRGGEQAHDITDIPIPAYGAVVLVRWD